MWRRLGFILLIYIISNLGLYLNAKVFSYRKKYNFYTAIAMNIFMIVYVIYVLIKNM